MSFMTIYYKIYDKRSPFHELFATLSLWKTKNVQDMVNFVRSLSVALKPRFIHSLPDLSYDYNAVWCRLRIDTVHTSRDPCLTWTNPCSSSHSFLQRLWSSTMQSITRHMSPIWTLPRRSFMRLFPRATWNSRLFCSLVIRVVNVSVTRSRF